MLESVLRPRPAQFLYGAFAVAAGLAIFTGGEVSTSQGAVPFTIVMPVLAVFFAVRLAGLTVAVVRGGDRMDWISRAISWIALAGVFFVLNVLTSAAGAVALAAFVALDAIAGAFAPRRDGTRGPSRLSAFSAKRWPYVALAYAALVIALHFLVFPRFNATWLLDWAALTLGFSAAAFFALAWPQGAEESVRAPADHRRHARVERPSEDPRLKTSEEAARAFLFEGDAEPLMSLARDLAAYANATPAEAKRLEVRVMQQLARPGTRREDDLEAALAALESHFSPPGPRGVRS